MLLKGNRCQIICRCRNNRFSFSKSKSEDKFGENIEDFKALDRSNYFYMPPKIMQIDGDKDYLTRCLNFYKKYNLQAIGKVLQEEELPLKIEGLLKEYTPDIIIITGHDAYYSKKETKTI